MDRQIVYPGQIARSVDFCQMQQNEMIALGYLGLGVFGKPAVVVGLAPTPTSPPSLSLVIGAGMLSTYTTVEGTEFGTSLPADLVDPLLKMGVSLSPTVLTFAAPRTPGQSQCFAIYALYTETDATPVVLPFLNQADPTDQYAGQGGDNEPLNTQRVQGITIGVVTGAPANVGSQAVPAIPQGAVPLCNLTLTYGQTTITLASVAIAANNPTIPYTLPQIPQYFQLKLGYVPANAAGDVPGGSLTFPGIGRVVTVGTAGGGQVVAGAISLGSVQVPGTFAMVGGFSVAGSAGVTGPLTVSGATTISGQLTANGGAAILGVASVANSGASVTDNTGNASFTVGGTLGGDTCIGFNSYNAYGLKMGITGAAYSGGAGVFWLGGWSDGASYRLQIDRAGNAVFSGGVNATTLLAVNGVFSQAGGQGYERGFYCRDQYGDISGSLVQSGSNGYIYISANAQSANAVTIDYQGDLASPGNINANGGITAGGQLQGAGGIITGGTITLGGAAGAAGQISYSADGSKTVMFCGGGALAIDRNGHAFTSLNFTATGDTAVQNNLAVGQVLTSTSSDIAIKDRLEPHGDALAVVRKLKVWDFNYIEDSGFDPDERHVGFIAQDVAEHMPHAYGEVMGTPSVFLHKAVPTLWRAQQQIAEENEVLRATIADLAARLAKIEASPPA